MSKPNPTKLNSWVISLFAFFLLLASGQSVNSAGIGQICESSAYDPIGNCEMGFCIDNICQLTFKPSVGIGKDFQTDTLVRINNSTIGQYIAAIYKYAVGIVGILSTVVMMIGGFVWITSGGSASRVSEAKAWIGGALTGLVLILSSWMIMNTINPATLKFKPLSIKPPDDILTGCCQINSDNGPQCGYETKDNCEKDADGSDFIFMKSGKCDLYGSKTCIDATKVGCCLVNNTSTLGGPDADLYHICKDDYTDYDCRRLKDATGKQYKSHPIHNFILGGKCQKSTTGEYKCSAP